MQQTFFVPPVAVVFLSPSSSSFKRRISFFFHQISISPTLAGQLQTWSFAVLPEVRVSLSWSMKQTKPNKTDKQ